MCQMLSHGTLCSDWMLMITLREGYHTHFTNQETEAWGDEQPTPSAAHRSKISLKEACLDSEMVMD